MEDALYAPTLRFVVSVAASLQFPKRRLVGGYAVGEGYYYELEGKELTAEEVQSLAKQVSELIASGDEISRVEKPWKEAVAYFEEQQLPCARKLLQTRSTSKVDCYECRGVLRLALTPVHERTAALKAGKHSVVHAAPGFVAAYTDKFVLQEAVLSSVRDHGSFADMQGVRCAGDLNALPAVTRSRKDYVLHCEFRQEAKLATLASKILERKESGNPVRVVCIAGPTASGKTTFATKLCMYLRNVGLVGKSLTVDHYYLPLNRQPKYQARQLRSDVDYDHVESMDVDLVGEHINALVSGQSVMTPIYNMKTGYRDGEGEHFPALPSNGILVIEGIHALNPLYTQAVDAGMVFKIFISPLTVMQLDDATVVPSTNHRLLRRMCRDYLFRAKSASLTLAGWGDVRRGEGVWIFPHQSNADFVMNSACDYEIPMLKTHLEPLLREVPADDPCFAKAQELLTMLDNFSSWPTELAPGTALVREFIGNGSFDCH